MKIYTSKYDRCFKCIHLNPSNKELHLYYKSMKLLALMLGQLIILMPKNSDNIIIVMFILTILKLGVYDEEKAIIQINYSYGLKYNETIRVYTISDKFNNQYVKNFKIYEIKKIKV